MKLKIQIGTLPIEVEFDSSDDEGAYRQLAITRPVFSAQSQITYTVSDTAPWEELGRVEMTSEGTSVTVSGTVVLNDTEPEIFAGIAESELMDVIGAERWHGLAQRAATEMGWPDSADAVSWQDVIRQLVVESSPTTINVSSSARDLVRTYLSQVLQDGILVTSFDEVVEKLAYMVDPSDEPSEDSPVLPQTDGGSHGMSDHGK